LRKHFDGKKSKLKNSLREQEIFPLKRNGRFTKKKKGIFRKKGKMGQKSSPPQRRFGRKVRNGTQEKMKTRGSNKMQKEHFYQRNRLRSCKKKLSQKQ